MIPLHSIHFFLKEDYWKLHGFMDKPLAYYPLVGMTSHICLEKDSLDDLRYSSIVQTVSVSVQQSHKWLVS